MRTEEEIKKAIETVKNCIAWNTEEDIALPRNLHYEQLATLYVLQWFLGLEDNGFAESMERIDQIIEDYRYLENLINLKPSN